MPAGVDESKWKKAKEIASESDNCPEEGTDDYWAYVQGVYKRMQGGKVDKKASEYVDTRLRKIAAASLKSMLDFDPPKSEKVNPQYYTGGPSDPDEAKTRLASLRMPTIRGRQPEYKYADTLRAVYGKNTEKELDKTRKYNKSLGAPYDLRRDAFRQFPLVSTKSPFGSVYSRSPRGSSVEQGITLPKDTDIRHPYIQAPPADDFKTWQNILAHEGVHSATMSDDIGDTSLEDFVRRIAPRHLSVAEGEAPKLRKKILKEQPMPPESIVDQALYSGPKSRVLIEHSALNSPITYPEVYPSEALPPLAGLQQYLYTTRGSRIESPREYDDFIAEYSRMSDEGKYQMKRDMNKKGFTEAVRLLNYRDRLDKGVPNDAGKTTRKLLKKLDKEGYGYPERLRSFDRLNRILIPGMARNNDSLNKNASEAVEARLKKIAGLPEN